MWYDNDKNDFGNRARHSFACWTNRRIILERLAQLNASSAINEMLACRSREESSLLHGR